MYLFHIFSKIFGDHFSSFQFHMTIKKSFNLLITFRYPCIVPLLLVYLCIRIMCVCACVCQHCNQEGKRMLSFQYSLVATQSDGFKLVKSRNTTDTCLYIYDPSLMHLQPRDCLAWHIIDMSETLREASGEFSIFFQFFVVCRFISFPLILSFLSKLPHLSERCVCLPGHNAAIGRT